VDVPGQSDSDEGEAVAASLDCDEMRGVLEAALEALTLPVMLHDEESILFANAATRQILGATRRDEIEGLTLDTFVVPEMLTLTQERRAYLLRDHAVLSGVPVKMKTLDGREIRLVVDARPIVVGERTFGLVTIAR
jgi:PAS domain S-box-containing protein